MVFQTTTARQVSPCSTSGGSNRSTIPAVEAGGILSERTPNPPSGVVSADARGSFCLSTLVLLVEGSPLRVEAARFVVESLVCQSYILQPNLLWPFVGGVVGVPLG